jgi:hypothetical protein
LRIFSFDIIVVKMPQKANKYNDPFRKERQFTHFERSGGGGFLCGVSGRKKLAGQIRIAQPNDSKIRGSIYLDRPLSTTRLFVTLNTLDTPLARIFMVL